MRGFSRETVVALAANIGSREWRRRYLAELNLPPEHPQASTTDDFKCFLVYCMIVLERISTQRGNLVHFVCTYNWYCRLCLGGGKLHLNLQNG